MHIHACKCIFIFGACVCVRAHTQNRNAFAHSLPPEKFETNRIKSTLEYVFIGIFTFFLRQKCNNNANQLNKLHDHLKSPNLHFSVSFSPHPFEFFNSFEAAEKLKQSPQPSKILIEFSKANANANSMFHHCIVIYTIHF